MLLTVDSDVQLIFVVWTNAGFPRGCTTQFIDTLSDRMLLSNNGQTFYYSLWLVCLDFYIRWSELWIEINLIILQHSVSAIALGWFSHQWAVDWYPELV